MVCLLHGCHDIRNCGSFQRNLNLIFEKCAKLHLPRWLVQFWHIFQISLVVLIINCTPSRVITYTKCTCLCDMILLTFPLIATSKSEDDPPEDFTVESEELNVTDKPNESAEKMCAAC